MAIKHRRTERNIFKVCFYNCASKHEKLCQYDLKIKCNIIFPVLNMLPWICWWKTITANDVIIIVLVALSSGTTVTWYLKFYRFLYSWKCAAYLNWNTWRKNDCLSMHIGHNTNEETNSVGGLSIQKIRIWIEILRILLLI